MKALICLQEEITPLQHCPSKLHQLPSYLMCSTPSDLRARSKWTGANGASRQRLIHKIQGKVCVLIAGMGTVIKFRLFSDMHASSIVSIADQVALLCNYIIHTPPLTTAAKVVLILICNPCNVFCTCNSSWTSQCTCT